MFSKLKTLESAPREKDAWRPNDPQSVLVEVQRTPHTVFGHMAMTYGIKLSNHIEYDMCYHRFEECWAYPYLALFYAFLFINQGTAVCAVHNGIDPPTSTLRGSTLPSWVGWPHNPRCRGRYKSLESRLDASWCMTSSSLPGWHNFKITLETCGT